MKCVKSHSGYAGYDKCCQRGVWDGKITYPETDCPLRSDISFRQMLDKEHHLGVSPFINLYIGMVSCFPLDYMHLVCLGVMRRLLMIWVKGPLPFKLSASTISALSNLMVSFRSFCCVEFSRKPRSLREIERWKATEFRQFVLYTGPVVLKKNLDKSLYDSFMLLHTAIYILIPVSPKFCLKYCDFADTLLRKFVRHSMEVYGNLMSVYNVHALIHLANDCKKFGCLNNFSAFPFENFLQSLKKLVRKSELPLQQVVKRLDEQNLFSCPQIQKSCDFKLRKEHTDRPISHDYVLYDQFRELSTQSVTLATNKANNCIKVKSGIALLQNILHSRRENRTILVVQKFLLLSDYYSYPLASSKLGIYVAMHLSEVSK